MAPVFKKRSSVSHPPLQRAEPTEPAEAPSTASLESSPTLHSHAASSYIYLHNRSATSPPAFPSVAEEDRISKANKALDPLMKLLELGILWKRKTVLSLGRISLNAIMSFCN